MNGVMKRIDSIFKKLKNHENEIGLKLEFEVNGKGKEYQFEGENINITIGRDSSNDVVIEHNSVSRNHARLWIKDGAIWVEDLGSKNGTFIRDKKIYGSQRVGNEITVGWVRVKIDMLTHKKDNDTYICDEKYLLVSLITGIILAITGTGIIILALFYSFL